MEKSVSSPVLNIIGRVIMPPVIKSNTNKQGKPYTRAEYMLDCGGYVVRVSSMTDAPPVTVPKMGELVSVKPVPGWQDDGLIKFDGEISPV